MKIMKVVVARYNEDVHWTLPIINHVIIYNKGIDDLDYIPKDKIIKCENLGREGGTYIKHIIDNYNNLDRYTIFLQGKNEDHVNNITSEEFVAKLVSFINKPTHYDFKYISRWMVPVQSDELTIYTSGLTSFPFREIPAISTNIIIDFINQSELSVENKQVLLSAISNRKTIQKHELISIVVNCNVSEIQNISDKLSSLYSHTTLIRKLGAKCSNRYTYGSGALFMASKKHIRRIPLDYWREIYSTLQFKSPPAGYGLEKMWRYLLE